MLQITDAVDDVADEATKLPSWSLCQYSSFTAVTLATYVGAVPLGVGSVPAVTSTPMTLRPALRA